METDMSKTSFLDRRDRAWELAGKASECLPKVGSWGYFSSEPPPSGIGAFCWFESREELVDFLVEFGPFLFPSESVGRSDEWPARAREFQAELQRFRLEEITSDALVDAAHKSIDTDGQLDWVGPLEELVSGRTLFAEEVRRALVDSEDDGGWEPRSPVPKRQTRRFLEDLVGYGH
jgi:hypothetical protein